jgi:chromosome segregation ATPase
LQFYQEGGTTMSTSGFEGQIRGKQTRLDQLDGNKTTVNSSINSTSQKVDFTKMEYIEGHDLLNSLVQINRIEHTGSQTNFSSMLGLQGNAQGNLDSAILAETQAAADKSSYEQNLTSMLNASDVAFGNLTTQLGIVDTTQANLGEATAVQGDAKDYLGLILNNHANMSANLDAATSNHVTAQDTVGSARQGVADAKGNHSDMQGLLTVAQDGERTATDSLAGAKAGVTNAKSAHGRAETNKTEATTAVSGATSTLSAANVNKANVEGELREAENAKSGNPVRRFLNWCASKISDLISSIKNKLSKATQEVQDAEKNLERANDRAKEAGDNLLEAFSGLMDAEEFEKLQEEYLAAAKDGVEAQQKVLDDAFAALMENEEALVAADASLAAMFEALKEAKVEFDNAVNAVAAAQERLDQALANVVERRAAFENAQGVRDEYLEIHEQKREDADRAQELDAAAAIILAGARGEVDTSSQEYLDAVAAVEAAREESERIAAEGTRLSNDMNGMKQHYDTLLSSLEDVISGKRVDLDDIQAQMEALQDEISVLEERVEAEAVLIAQLQERQAASNSASNGERGGFAQIGNAFNNGNDQLMSIQALEAAIASNCPDRLKQAEAEVNRSWNTAGKLVQDFQNFNINNEDEDSVLASNFFSGYRGQFVVRAPVDRSGSFGIMVLGTNQNINDSGRNTVQHEYGHFEQLKELNYNPIKYLFGIGLPSYQSEVGGRGDNNEPLYYSQPWEVTADTYGDVDEQKRGGWTEGAVDAGDAYMEELKNTSTFGVVWNYFFPKN